MPRIFQLFGLAPRTHDAAAADEHPLLLTDDADDREPLLLTDFADAEAPVAGAPR